MASEGGKRLNAAAELDAAALSGSALGVDLLSREEFPVLYLAAAHSSQLSQQRFLAASRLRLAALVTAAVCGTVSVFLGRLDLTAVGAAAGLGAALVVEVYLLRVRPERKWYDARAAAESAKTLAWRYLVAGQPFGKERGGERQADRLLLTRLMEITKDLRGFAPVPLADSSLQITAGMRKVRALSLKERRLHYLQGRIKDQQAWYTGRAEFNERRATQWSVLLAAFEALGLMAAVLKAARAIDFDLTAIFAALATAAVAWLQTKQHDTLASAYAIAALELADVASRVEGPASEAEWAHFVDEAEEAISREHTLWRASHT